MSEDRKKRGVGFWATMTYRNRLTKQTYVIQFDADEDGPTKPEIDRIIAPFHFIQR